jgi:hypothetical protein
VGSGSAWAEISRPPASFFLRRLLFDHWNNPALKAI